MDLIELHILHSFPVTCLNRDDVGAPKSARFGGVQRARVSSQCWKRAIRALAGEYAPEHFAGERSRYVVTALNARFVAAGMPESQARTLAIATADAIGKLDDPEQGNVKTLLFYSPMQLDKLVVAVAELGLSIEDLAALNSDDGGEGKKRKGKVKGNPADRLKKAVKALGAPVRDAADIAIFGRMVADDDTLTVEAAGLFSHALSTHAVSSELDFFSAVDERKPIGDDAGAGHIGTLEFNSACYYRYVGLNLDMLMDSEHLGHFTPDERAHTVGAFIRASLLAVPGARKNSMFGFNPPVFTLGLRRRGQPLSLVNAFESPVASPRGGYCERSKDLLMAHWKSLCTTYGLSAGAELCTPPSTMDELIGALAGEIGR
jgi:CRISPR system Cascade subunit CasC